MPSSWFPIKSIVAWKQTRQKCGQKFYLEDQGEGGYSLSSSDKIMRLSNDKIVVKTKSVKENRAQMENGICLLTESPFRILKLAAKGKLEEVQKLYNSNRDRLLITDSKGWSVIHHAAANDKDRIITFFANHGADLNEITRDGETPLHIAVLHDAVSALKVLIRCGADTSIKNVDHGTPLHLAVRLNKIDALEAMIENKDLINMHLVDDHGRTALHIAATYDFDVAAKMLVETYKICPNQPCNNGFYPIHLAAKNASVRVLEVLLTWAERNGCERRKMITVPDSEGNVPLHLAVHGGEIKAVELCLRNGANISWQQHDNSTPVHLASSQGAVDIVKLMFSLQPDEKMKVLETTDAQGMTPLHCAAMFDHAELVSYLLEQGASVNKLEKEHRSPVLLAASQKCWRTVEVLLNQGADPAIRDAKKRNILHIIIMNGGNIRETLFLNNPSGWAVYEERRNKLMLQDWSAFGVSSMFGCSPKSDGDALVLPGKLWTLYCYTRSVRRLENLLNDQDTSGCSPMHYASQMGQTSSLASLIELGASVRIKNQKNESPLHFAARYGRYNSVKQLLEYVNGFLIMNESDEAGKTALHIASEDGHTKVLQLLLSKGALLHRDNQGRTPLHLAASGGHVEAINIILSVWGYLLDQKDKDGNTPLHLAVMENKPEAVNRLLNLNCKFLENNSGFKPIDYAIQYKLHEAAIAIVTHERGIWHSLINIEKYYNGVSKGRDGRMKEVMQSPSEIHGCVCIALIRTLPKVFEAALNQAITRAKVKENSKGFYLKYSFYALQLTEEQIDSLASLKNDPSWRPPPLLSVNAMVQSGRIELLLHPLTQKYLQMKWQAYGMYIHLANLFVYLVFLTMVTIFAAWMLGSGNSPNTYPIGSYSNGSQYVTDKDSLSPVNKKTTSLLLAIAILCFAVLGLFKEFLQMYQQRLKYIADAINFVMWILYSATICMVLPTVFGASSSEEQYNSAAIAVLTAWFTLLLYFQRFDYIGIYIVMFLEILNTLLKVLAVFSVLIVAFGLAFHILLSRGNHLAFSNAPLTLIRTFSMMLGEIDFMNTFVYPFFQLSPKADVILLFPKTTFIILVVFMILMPILLMNLLIGLAVGDIESVKKNAQLKRIAMQVDLHTELENKLPNFLIKKVNKQEILVYPNDTNCRSNFFQKAIATLNCFTLFGDVQSKAELDGNEISTDDLFFDEIEHQRRLFRDLQTQMNQQLNLLRLIMQKMDISSEADETDEGVSLPEIMQPQRQVRRWIASSRASRKALQKFE